MTRPRWVVAGAVLGSLLLGGCAAPDAPDSRAVAAAPAAPPEETAPATQSAVAEGRRTAKPLRGTRIVLDPGHQLGNRNFPEKINRQVPAGGFTKACNTTGTSTNGGYAEATFGWQVTRQVRRRLEKLGARVQLTRSTNSAKRWGPCVDERGRAGNSSGADLKLSIHGDGSYADGAHGFHVIAPTDRRPWTHDIYRSSRLLATKVRAALHRRAGLDHATYVAGGDGLDFRADLGTLNLSDVPTVMVELGNMRDAGDARMMTSRRGRATYAKALVQGARAFVRSHATAQGEPLRFDD
jgi:N-acetylmuramoyl-L-alanine amidase